MPREIIGSSRADGSRFAIVVSRFNEDVTDRLLDGAVSTLRAHGVAEADITVARVPGAFEIPPVAARLASHTDDAGKPRYRGIICLGAVIRGETPHFDQVAARATQGIGAVADRAPMPVIFGVLTCDTYEQALARAGGTPSAGVESPASQPATAAGQKPVVDNKGVEAALAALETSGLYEAIEATDA